MYDIILFLHVLSALIYLLFHGAVASVTFALKREQLPERNNAFDGVMVLAYNVTPYALAVLVLSGILLGFLGRWWADGWIWVGLGLLLGLGVLMNRLGRASLFEGFRKADQPATPNPPASQTGRRASLRGFFLSPMYFAVTGIGTLALILGLMMFKPF
jgi:hypothetical protein